MPDITMSTCCQHWIAHVDPHVGRISVVRTTARAWVCGVRRNNRHIFGCDRNGPAFADSLDLVRDATQDNKARLGEA